MANVVVLDNLLSEFLSEKGKDIITSFNTTITADNYSFEPYFTALNTIANGVVTGIRLIICEADGTVIYDSSKVNLNTFQNFKDKKINENHNSRLAIIRALLSASGRGYEVKRSTTTSNSTEYYVASRLGFSSENAVGTVRISHTGLVATIAT